MQDESTAKRALRAEAWHSDGFAAPTFTMVPNDLFDEIAPHLTEAELRVLLYILRRTFGWQKEADTISLSQMADGITGHDGHAVDHGTGMSKVGVRNGVKGLEAKGLIVTVPHQSPARGHEATTYRLRFRGPLVSDANKGGKPSLPAPVHEAYTQKNSLQNTDGGDAPGERAATIWTAVLAAIQQTPMTDANFTTWWAGTVGREIDGAALVVQAPNKFTGEWLQTRCRPLARKMLRQIAPALTDVRFVPRS